MLRIGGEYTFSQKIESGLCIVRIKMGKGFARNVARA